MVIATGRPSGIAETARAMVMPNTSASGAPRRIWPAASSSTTTTVATAIRRERARIRSSKGGGAWSGPRARAMAPSWVRPAVAQTTPVPRPARTMLPAKAMLRRSASGVPLSRADSAFSTTADSPVNRDSSIRRSWVDSRRRSAGTAPPDSSKMTSPGARSAASISRREPSRSTVGRTCRTFFSAAALVSARHSSAAPMPASSSSTAKMNRASLQAPSARETTLAASRT